MGSFVWGLGMAAALGAIVAVAACATPNFGDDLGTDNKEVRLPDRQDERIDDAGRPTPPTSPRPTPTPTPDPKPPVDAGRDAPPPRSAFCSEADLLLCFEFENVVKDSSVNAIDPAVVQGVTFVPGKAGLAAAVDSQSAIHFGYSAMFNTPAATIEAWVRLTPNPPNNGVVFDADNRFAMEIETNGELKCITVDGSSTGGTVTKGQFTHVACTFEAGGRIRNYVNGVERSSANGHLGTSTTAGAAIAGNAPSGDPFTGAIDSFRVFRRVRTAAEIAFAAR